MSTDLIEAAVIEQSMVTLALEADPTVNPLTLQTGTTALGPSPETSESSHQRRDVKTSILHANEELYQEQLKAKGGKEDMWQGGDLYYPNPPKIAHDVVIEDISGRERDFTLDNSGFFLAKHQFKSVVTTEDLGDTDKIKTQYYPELEEWLKKVTGASRVCIFDHAARISTSTFQYNEFKKDPEAKKAPPQPALFSAHLDYSSWHSGNLLHRYLPDETERLLHGRFMILNVWRPIKTVYKDPLGIAAAFSVAPTDLVTRQARIFKDINEALSLKYSPAHKWYYKFAQQPDEVLVFKQFDNYGKTRGCPHAAFKDEEFVDREGRESIEVRALCFWPDFYDDK
ncbi:hypothetical protein FKW77_007758 [Venturia effusa]|uniref:Uncharacterized protein n=1 Tax=Venturia effusa TaxID=50376 RepID=A0A517LKL7_9PEZI|nr:hypothetical protein FKW77_007758 [Venturia effusa]